MNTFSKTKFYSSIRVFLTKTTLYFLLALSVWLLASYLKTTEPYLTWIRRAAIIIGILQTGRWGNDLISAFIHNFSGWTSPSNRAARGLISFFAKLFLYSFLVLVSLDVLGFNITAVIAGLGIGGIAIALSVQNILSDLFSSLTIVLDKPFEIGDFITVGSAKGTVESIGIKTTRLRALSGEQLIFSNSDLLQSRIHNFKRMSERRIAFTIRLAHDTSVDQILRAKKIISEEITKLEKTRLDRCHFFQIGETSIDFEAVYFIKDPDYNAYMDLHENLLIGIRRHFSEESHRPSGHGPPRQGRLRGRGRGRR